VHLSRRCSAKACPRSCAEGFALHERGQYPRPPPVSMPLIFFFLGVAGIFFFAGFAGRFFFAPFFFAIRSSLFTEPIAVN
jgi:hypothetical protein